MKGSLPVIAPEGKSGFQPGKYSMQLVSKITGQESSEQWIDEPVFTAYNAGREYNSNAWGSILQTDVSGCPYRCSFCWVHDEALAGRVNGNFLKNKIDKLPSVLKKSMNDKGVVTADELYAVLEKKAKSLEAKGQKIDLFTFSGGSPTLYRGGLLRFAELARGHGRKVGIYTEGFHIATNEDYLKPFVDKGLQDTLQFYVSVKNATPDTFKQLTGVSKEFSESHFIAAKKLMENGFLTYVGGTELDTLATPDQLKLEGDENPIIALHKKLTAIHPDLPRAITYNKVTYGMVHDPKGQANKMRTRGYLNEKGAKSNMAPALVQEQLEQYFEEQGTPIMPFSSEVPRSENGIEILERIKDDLNRAHKRVGNRSLAIAR